MFQSKPYVMAKVLDRMPEPEEYARMVFTAKYEGFVVDLIKELSREVKFKYEMYIVADQNYGAFNQKTGQWNGMIKDLIDHVCVFKLLLMI